MTMCIGRLASLLGIMTSRWDVRAAASSCLTLLLSLEVRWFSPHAEPTFVTRLQHFRHGPGSCQQLWVVLGNSALALLSPALFLHCVRWPTSCTSAVSRGLTDWHSEVDISDVRFQLHVLKTPLLSLPMLSL